MGHSFGGFNVRVFTGQHPGHVLGMVLVDASHEDEVQRIESNLSASVWADIERSMASKAKMMSSWSRSNSDRSSPRFPEVVVPGDTKWKFGDARHPEILWNPEVVWLLV